jgi:polyisoprenoid-binding protein YceI
MTVPSPHRNLQWTFSCLTLTVGAVTAYTGNFRLGPDTGRVVIKTGRAGMAAKAGHDLTIEVTRWSARVEVPAGEDGGVTAATVTAELDLGSLEVREGTGGVKPLTDGDRAQIKKQMENILGGATATFASARIIPSGASGGAIEGSVTLNGKTQPSRLQVTTPDSGRYRGTATVVQSAFGIKPYTGFFGALKLRDEVAVEFEVDLSKAEAAGNAEPA